MKLKLQISLMIFLCFSTFASGQIATFKGKVNSNLFSKDNLKIHHPGASIPDSTAIVRKISTTAEKVLDEELDRLENGSAVNEYKKKFERSYGSVSDLINQRKNPMDYFPDSLTDLNFDIDSSKITQQIESLATRQLRKNKDVDQAARKLKKEEGFLDDYSQNFDDPVESLRGDQRNPSKLISNIPKDMQGELLAKARKLTSAKKSKFSSFNSGNSEGNVKASSLSDAPFKKRLLFECDLQVQIDKETTIDLLPVVGWRVNRAWSIAGGASYRIFIGSDGGLYTSQSVMGYRFLSDHQLWRTIFIRGEFESVNVSREGDKGSENYWSDAASLGAGNTFNFSEKIKGKVVIQYNFLHNDASVNSNPFVIRFGVSI